MGQQRSWSLLKGIVDPITILKITFQNYRQFRDLRVLSIIVSLLQGLNVILTNISKTHNSLLWNSTINTFVNYVLVLFVSSHSYSYLVNAHSESKIDINIRNRLMIIGFFSFIGTLLHLFNQSLNDIENFILVFISAIFVLTINFIGVYIDEDNWNILSIIQKGISTIVDNIPSAISYLFTSSILFIPVLVFAGIQVSTGSEYELLLTICMALLSGPILFYQNLAVASMIEKFIKNKKVEQPLIGQ